MSYNGLSKLGPFYGRVIYRPEPTTLAPTCRPNKIMGYVPPPLIKIPDPEPMTMNQINEYYDRILLGNLCVKCDQDFVAEGKEFCPKCSKRPEITIGSL